MKIKQILSTQMILCMTAAFITCVQAMPFEDDLVNHCTRVGGKVYPHTGTPGKDIPPGTVIFIDERLPKDRQLSLTPRGKIIHYTCPAIPGIKGLEKPRSMGMSPQYITQESDTTRATATGIELIKSSCNLQSWPILPGFYHSLGTINLLSKIEKEQRINTKRLTCHTGQGDGVIIDLEYKEFLYHIPHSLAFSKGCLTRENPKTTAAPCFTFSCWVLPSQQKQEIFSWSYLAPEPELKVMYPFLLNLQRL